MAAIKLNSLSTTLAKVIFSNYNVELTFKASPLTLNPIPLSIFQAIDSSMLASEAHQSLTFMTKKITLHIDCQASFSKKLLPKPSQANCLFMFILTQNHVLT